MKRLFFGGYSPSASNSEKGEYMKAERQIGLDNKAEISKTLLSSGNPFQSSTLKNNAWRGGERVRGARVIYCRRRQSATSQTRGNSEISYLIHGPQHHHEKYYFWDSKYVLWTLRRKPPFKSHTHISALKMEVKFCSETVVPTNKTKWRYDLEHQQ